MNCPPLLCITGPTGSGKSELALDLAAALGGEIVNCDSLQVYRHFDIGSAKVPVAQRRGIPHHLLDVVDPNGLFTAGDYSRLGRETLASVSARGKLPIVVGGTGFYLRALLDGLFPGPSRDEKLRARLTAREGRRPGSLHRILRRFDPPTAARIHPNDSNKILRALEVCLAGHLPMSDQFALGRKPLTGFQTLKIGLDPPRDALRRRIGERVVTMFESGLIEEVRRILALGFAETSKPFEAIGYKEALECFRGNISVSDAITAAQIATRQYAKRQMTWFRRDAATVWLAGFGAAPQVRGAALEISEHTFKKQNNRSMFTKIIQ